MNIKLSPRQIALNAVLAAAYAALTIATSAFSYGPIQFRVAEALCVLPYFFPQSIWGLVIGCLLANVFSTVSALDMVVGTAATLIAALMTARCRNKYLALLPPVVVNALLVGAMLGALYTPESFWSGFLLFAAQVGAGELAVMYTLGAALAVTIPKLYKALPPRC